MIFMKKCAGLRTIVTEYHYLIKRLKIYSKNIHQ